MALSIPPLLDNMELVTEQENNIEATTEEESSQEASNPMLNDVVIDNLFGYCEFKDLANYRLVSKQWFKVTLPHWLRAAPMITLPFDETIRSSSSSSLTRELIAQENNDGRSKTMCTFLVATHNEFHQYGAFEFAGLRKYTKFETGGDTNLPMHHQLLQNFLRHCGEWITDLQVSLRFRDLDIFQAVMLSKKTPNLVSLTANVAFLEGGGDGFEVAHNYELGKAADIHSKLKSLQIDIKNTPDDDDEEEDEEEEEEETLPVIGWIQLLQRYPNLKTLVFGNASLTGIRPATIRDADRLLEAIWTISTQGDRKKLLDLKRLDIDVCMGENASELAWLLPVFRDAGLALEKCLVAFGPRTPNQTIYAILESQAATLKELCIRKWDVIKSFQPPKMNSVEKLEVFNDPIQDLSFFKGFPSLKSFILYPGGAEDVINILLNNTTEEQLEGLVIPSLTSFESRFEPNSADFVSPEGVRKLSRVMPNLKKLVMGLDNESFRAVCECWPQLEHLSMVGVIAGDGEAFEQKIINLRGLKSLKMRNVDRNYKGVLGPTVITDKSVAVLLTLPNLEELKIWIDKELDAVSMNVIKTLEAKIKNCTIKWASRKGPGRILTTGVR